MRLRPHPSTPTPKQPNDLVDPASSRSTTKPNSPSGHRHRTRGQKVLLVILIIATLGLIGTIITFFLLAKSGNNLFHVESPEFPDPIYSILTGEEITDASLNSNPTYCVQIPNGTDGARPQAGLTHAAVVFEAIAESGITRFAAIFQNPDTSVIGPIRSLRPYYLDWDTPFDCTVVHAGGSDEAIAALRAGGHRELDENYTYMWRETGTSRLWNNLFTSPTDLSAWNTAQGWNTSDPEGFPRLLPEDIDQLLRARTACAEDPECTPEPLVTDFSFNFGNWDTFNTIYHYDANTNTYLRSYATGDAHLVYDCPADLSQPTTTTECGELVQIAPSVVIAMVVEEHRMADGYHEDITTIGSGPAYIFQNGTVTEGTWEKSSQSSQIRFLDAAGEPVSLTPGQLWIAAVPEYGSVIY